MKSRDSTPCRRVWDHMEEEITWSDAPGDESELRRRLRQCETILGLISTGVAVLEPVGNDATLRVSMVNDIAATYFGRLGDFVDPAASAEAGMRDSGLFNLALLVSLTGQEHLQEAVPVPGAAAAGQIVDLAITPLEDGAVAIVFDDVTQRVRQAEAG